MFKKVSEAFYFSKNCVKREQCSRGIEEEH